MLDNFVGEKMKNVFALVALSLALSLSACTKKEETATPPAGEQVEGTTTAPAEGQAPAEEMQEKKDEAAPAAH
jgi:hypothetical protein